MGVPGSCVITMIVGMWGKSLMVVFVSGIGMGVLEGIAMFMLDLGVGVEMFMPFQHIIRMVVLLLSILGMPVVIKVGSHQSRCKELDQHQAPDSESQEDQDGFVCFFHVIPFFS